MNSGTVHLIATDPPFNKNRDFHATPDSLSAGARFQDRWSWDRDVHEEWVDAIKDDWPAAWAVIDWSRMTYGDDMAAFLCWLGVRLMEMHRVLREDGSIYLHCDPTASHYIKSMLDAIFGKSNFRNEIVWERTAGRSDAKTYARVHDIILYYVKSASWQWNQQYDPLSPEYIEKSYRYADRNGRYTTMPLSGGGISGKTHDFTWRGVHASNWRYTRKSLEELDSKGMIHWSRNRKPRRKFYLSESKGVAARDVIRTINRAPASERTGYPTQKPLALYEHIIKASSNLGDMVLDPFAGCATTPVAAERLGRQWIGMDIWEGAADIVKQRLESERRMFESEQVRVITTPPVRTDDNDVAAPVLKSGWKRPTEPWQRLTHNQMSNVLVYCQSNGEGVVCAGCGRILEKEFMQLDHITPRSDRGTNDILNRILLCGPCNLRKGNTLTLAGLLLKNRRHGWMKHADRARIARDNAEACALRVRYELDTAECQSLLNGEGLTI